MKIAEIGFESLSVAENNNACVDSMRIKPTEIHELAFGSASSAENGNTRVDNVKMETTELYVSLIISIRETLNRHESPRLHAN